MNLLHRIWRCLLVWDFVPGPEQDLQNARLIVTQCCSRSRDGSAGRPNQVLAKTTLALQRRLGLSVFPQEEIPLAEPDIRCVGIAGGSSDGRSTLTWNTETIAAAQADYCRAHGITHVILVAFPFHMNRARWTYERLGLKVTPAPVHKDMRLYVSRNLIHMSHRFIWTAFLREFFCRTLFLIQGKI